MPNPIIDSIKINGVTYDISIDGQQDLNLGIVNAENLFYRGANFSDVFASIDHKHDNVDKLGYVSQDSLNSSKTLITDYSHNDQWFMMLESGDCRPSDYLSSPTNPNTYRYPRLDCHQVTHTVDPSTGYESDTQYDYSVILPNESCYLRTGYRFRLVKYDSSTISTSSYITIKFSDGTSTSKRISDLITNNTVYYDVVGFYFGSSYSISTIEAHEWDYTNTGIFAYTLLHWIYATSASNSTIGTCYYDTPNSTYGSNKYYKHYSLTSDTTLKIKT